eukprot:GFYU01001360.1.p1 GENE.GFYU01001360.1~~GFYU01001360.1.p1  ORF type:complete len:290 (+),score=56.21 GFYU01001360.1:248-1117(+)
MAPRENVPKMAATNESLPLPMKKRPATNAVSPTQTGDADYTAGLNQPPILTYAFDIPNIITLAGMSFAVLGMYLALHRQYNLSLASIMLSTIADWFDGFVARRLKGRTPAQAVIGAQLDSLCDVVSFGVFPSILVLEMTTFHPLTVAFVVVYVACIVVRLSYFNHYGLIDGKFYYGLSVDHNAMLLSVVYPVAQLVTTYATDDSSLAYSIIVVCVFVSLAIAAALNVSSLLVPKTGSGFAFFLYVLSFSVLALINVYMHFSYAEEFAVHSTTVTLSKLINPVVAAGITH